MAEKPLKSRRFPSKKENPEPIPSSGAIFYQQFPFGNMMMAPQQGMLAQQHDNKDSSNSTNMGSLGPQATPTFRMGTTNQNPPSWNMPYQGDIYRPTFQPQLNMNQNSYMDPMGDCKKMMMVQQQQQQQQNASSGRMTGNLSVPVSLLASTGGFSSETTTTFVGGGGGSTTTSTFPQHYDLMYNNNSTNNTKKNVNESSANNHQSSSSLNSINHCRPRSKSLDAAPKNQQSQGQSNEANDDGTMAATSTGSQRSGSGGGRRMKRLERNRESARLSRRRRKQYLEVLEERVGNLSETMDEGRRNHVSKAVEDIRRARNDHMESLERKLTTQTQNLSLNDNDNMNEDQGPPSSFHSSGSGSGGSDHQKASLPWYDMILCTALRRTSDETRVASAFQREQLKSLATPLHSRFILWLTLQNDCYFAGGRAISERLSAARIGERMLNGGNDRVPPSNGMWPLFCNEINLSFDQEEKFRRLQQSILNDRNSWMDCRHSMHSSSKIIESLHSAIDTLSELAKKKESNSFMNVLTMNQRIKFLVWMKNKLQRQEKEKIDAILRLREQERLSHNFTRVQNELPTNSPEYHSATNSYIIDKRLMWLHNYFHRFTSPPILDPAASKRLSRRPPFESLSGVCTATGDQKSMTRENSFPSSGSLKRSASTLSNDIDETEGSVTSDQNSINSGNALRGASSSTSPIPSTSVPTITPAAAQQISYLAVVKALKPAGVVIPDIVGLSTAALPSPVTENQESNEEVVNVDVDLTPGEGSCAWPDPLMFADTGCSTTSSTTTPMMDSIAETATSAVDLAQSQRTNHWAPHEQHENNNINNNSAAATAAVAGGQNHSFVVYPVTSPALSAQMDVENLPVHQIFDETNYSLPLPTSTATHIGHGHSHNHSAMIPSILPNSDTEMNIVPEEGELHGGQTMEEYFLDLNDDWAIGGFDVELNQ